MTYSEKLKDPRWIKRRADYYETHKERENSKKLCCEWCYVEDQKYHLHHLIYRKDREPWEYPDEELVLLCPECHENAHKYLNELNESLVYIMKDVHKAMAFMNVSHFMKLANGFGSAQLVRALDVLMTVNDIGLGDNWSTMEWLINMKKLD